MILAYDARAATPEDKSGILAEVHNIIADAKNMWSGGLMVDFSGTHFQSNYPTSLLPEGEHIFGGTENQNFVKAAKKKHDPSNRFRYHPFSSYFFRE